MEVLENTVILLPDFSERDTSYYKLKNHGIDTKVNILEGLTLYVQNDPRPPHHLTASFSVAKNKNKNKSKNIKTNLDGQPSFPRKQKGKTVSRTVNHKKSVKQFYSEQNFIVIMHLFGPKTDVSWEAFHSILKNLTSINQLI